ncbi:hypothetical protein B296_00035635 [Ensete ventricosum]|uniref:Uncharacterized protein n=1 Tax=Ensete ventricosum TaxID=4639 RepID=A0A426YD01_ENSVE|nr:hypothetical protein B296_00035635 [Ensete ventricosum]
MPTSVSANIADFNSASPCQLQSRPVLSASVPTNPANFSFGQFMLASVLVSPANKFRPVMLTSVSDSPVDFSFGQFMSASSRLVHPDFGPGQSMPAEVSASPSNFSFDQSMPASVSANPCRPQSRPFTPASVPTNPTNKFRLVMPALISAIFADKFWLIMPTSVSANSCQLRQIDTSNSDHSLRKGHYPGHRSMSIVRQGVHQSASAERLQVHPSPKEHDSVQLCTNVGTH